MTRDLVWNLYLWSIVTPDQNSSMVLSAYTQWMAKPKYPLTRWFDAVCYLPNQSLQICSRRKWLAQTGLLMMSILFSSFSLFDGKQSVTAATCLFFVWCSTTAIVVRCLCIRLRSTFGDWPRMIAPQVNAFNNTPSPKLFDTDSFISRGRVRVQWISKAGYEVPKWGRLRLVFWMKKLI